MGISCVKLKKNGVEETKLDLRYDTVAPETLGDGVTAHDKHGDQIVGTASFGEYALYGTYVLKKAYNLYDIDVNQDFGYESVYSHFYTENGWEYAQVEEIYLSDIAEIYSDVLSTAKVYDALEGGWVGDYGKFPDDRYLIIDFVEKQVVSQEFYNAFLLACDFIAETAFDIGMGLSTGVAEQYTVYGTYMLTDTPTTDIVATEEMTAFVADGEVYSYFYNSTDGWSYEKVIGIVAAGNMFGLGSDNSSKISSDGFWINGDGEQYRGNRYKIIDFKTPVMMSADFYYIFIRFINNNSTTPYDIGITEGYNMAVASAITKEVSIESNGITTISDDEGNLMKSVIVNVNVESEGSEYILSGTQMFMDETQVESHAQLELDLNGAEVLSWFFDNYNPVYDRVGKIIIGQQKFTIYSEDLSYQNELFGGEWTNQDGDVLTNVDARHKIIDFRTPTKVTKEFYDIFVSVVDNDDFTPYDIGYDVGFNGGYVEGWYDGYDEGYDDGYSTGYDSGVVENAPSGTFDITSNGTFNISKYEYVDVNVSTGTLSGVDGEALLDGSITTIMADVAKVKQHTCRSCSSLKTVKLPICTTVETYAFYYCTSMSIFEAPKLKTLGSYALYNCTKLTNVNLPLVTALNTQTFNNCTGLTTADFGSVGSIASSCFSYCSKLTTLILRKTSAICTLSNTNAFTGSAIAKNTGYIYVPSALLDTYKSATNWSTYASQFRAIEDYPDIVGA